MEQVSSIDKSTRHQKIIGDFGEAIFCNWLSRSGFEVAIIDHTGIDIVAYNKKTKKRLGISVKSRTRTSGKEAESVNIFFNEKKDRNKLEMACKAFCCKPWIGVYVETADYGDMYLMSLSHYDKKYNKKNRVLDDWKMTEKCKKQYVLDEQIKHLHIKFENLKRWKW
jgi:Holliday junction resolvase-like predicted endonuclease